jgi:hypothetical protein
MNVQPYYNTNSKEFLECNHTHYIPPPKPSLNGGLFTGEEFHKDAPYRNFPQMPDSVYLHTKTLSSANPPPGSQHQFPDTYRPGNNLPVTMFNGVFKFSDKHAIVCTTDPSRPINENYDQISLNKQFPY